MGVGYGVFTEMTASTLLRDNILINIGESYIVANFAADPDFANVVQLKLRVFSAIKADLPDLYTCQNIDQVLVIGRSPNCDIRIDDELLSKMQATVYFNSIQKMWAIEDGY